MVQDLNGRGKAKSLDRPDGPNAENRLLAFSDGFSFSHTTSTKYLQEVL